MIKRLLQHKHTALSCIVLIYCSYCHANLSSTKNFTSSKPIPFDMLVRHRQCVSDDPRFALLVSRLLVFTCTSASITGNLCLRCRKPCCRLTKYMHTFYCIYQQSAKTVDRRVTDSWRHRMGWLPDVLLPTPQSFDTTIFVTPAHRYSIRIHT